ncbi:MAG: 30S ribosomal protein S1 [Bacteroidetes bacterium]|nr:MAG: 30S ribosomal protein S1 [Bacteroidota bacterium]
MAESEADITTESQTSLQEEYLNSFNNLEEGQLIEGTVIEISTESVFIDIGYKSEGKIPIEEFKDKPAIGDIVNVVLISKEGKGGQVIVSKGKADEKVFWKDLKNAFQEKLPVDGKFISSNKGGFEINLGHDIIGFCPLSKTDIVRVEDSEKYIGMKSKFYIERLYSDNKLKIVVSRRNYLEKEISAKKEKFFSETELDSVVTGEVKSFTSFGAFIDLGGFDGLLHINDMSWGHVTRPKDYVKKDQKIELKVIKLDSEKQKINLSLKHFTPDPWSVFEDKYATDDIVKGKVTKLSDFGAFIEIEEGIEGLVHISELSWVKRVKHPGEVLTIGDEVETKILGYDLTSGRVSLGLKQVLQNPWDNLEETFPIGHRLKAKVVKITNAGAFIELTEGIDGFLHVDDLSWTRRVKNPSSMLKVGEEVEVLILDIDKVAHRIRLGFKQLSEDPWNYLKKNHPKNSPIDGEITNITDFGVFVKVVGGIEGLVSKYNLVEPGAEDSRDEDYLSRFKTGQKVKALITEINPKAQRLSLSIKDYDKSIQRKEISKYIHDEDEGSNATFGDFLKGLDSDSKE